MSKWLCSIALMVALQAQSRHATGPAMTAAAAEAAVTAAMRAFDVPGVSLAVVKDGRVEIAKGYGASR